MHMVKKKTDEQLTDIVGRRFGKLTVLNYTKRTYQHQTLKSGLTKKQPLIWYNCICDCGNYVEATRSSLQSKDGRKSCGCKIGEWYKKNSVLMRKFQPGYKVHKLTVVEILPEWKYRTVCDCGKEKILTGQRLQYIKSCGCLRVRQGPKSPHWKMEPFEHFLSQYKKGAESRKLEFNLTNEDFSRLIDAPCYYCSSPPREYKLGTSKIPKTITANGIDRVDSSLGYTPANCATCCTTCNVMKMNLSQEAFLERVKKIYENLFVRI